MISSSVTRSKKSSEVKLTEHIWLIVENIYRSVWPIGCFWVKLALRSVVVELLVPQVSKLDYCHYSILYTVIALLSNIDLRRRHTVLGSESTTESLR